jgi:hypothetical protein
MDAHLSSHHRDTIAKIFSHPASGNIEWRQVLSLLENLGTTTEERNGKFKVALGPETEVLERPRGKDINEQLIVDTGRARPRPWRCTVGRTYLIPLMSPNPIHCHLPSLNEPGLRLRACSHVRGRWRGDDRSGNDGCVVCVGSDAVRGDSGGCVALFATTSTLQRSRLTM